MSVGKVRWSLLLLVAEFWDTLYSSSLLERESGSNPIVHQSGLQIFRSYLELTTAIQFHKIYFIKKWRLVG